MRPRHFKAGDAFIVGGINFRVVEGCKKPKVPGAQDLRLDWYVGERWQPVTLDPIFLVVDMICENEDVLYPFPQRGGEEVITYLRLAKNAGWRKAVAKLHKARGDKQDREAELSLYVDPPAPEDEEGAA